jgi:hypothetical protein
MPKAPAVMPVVAAAKPVAPVVAPEAVKPVVQAAAAPARAIVETASPVAAAAAQAPTSVAAFAALTPKPPQFASVAGAGLLTQTLAFARTVGALQASMLDHACAELKATLGEVETLARTDSAADAVALQAKAVRRGLDAQAAHLKDLAAIATSSLRRD